MRIVIDTNCWFGILPIDAPYGFIADRLVEGAFTLVVSTQIMLEYEEIIGGRLKNVDTATFTSLLTLLDNVEKIEPSFRFGLISADADDNKFVDCAIAGQADLIVTDDRHFEVLEKIVFPKVSILSLNAFAGLLPQ